MLGVESINSDLDLLITTYECLFDRKSFYLALEQKLTSLADVEELVIVLGANIPLIKF